MDTCPHCGSPGSFDDATDGRCPVCGMALPLQSEAAETSEATTEATAAPVRSEPDSSTLRPAQLAPNEAATIALPDQPSEQDDDYHLPQGADLIRPRMLSPAFARRVTAAWQQTHSKFNNPQETIKSENSGVFEIGDLNIGARVVGPVEEPTSKDYDLTEVIGEGAMGVIWSARQASLDRDVAIKYPKGAAADTEMGRRQFMSEVVVTGQLDHPNIVPIYDLGKDTSGQLFYSMKRVEGRPWNELLEQRELNLQENLETLMKVCDAIRFAHDRGVIHRDIKPHNVMVGQYGEVSMMDWGIALRLDLDASHNAIAKISPAGTPAYMAPEMATGNASDIGPATDVYLLGAVLYEILTGEPPHPPPTDSQNHRQILTEALLIAARNNITPIGHGGELGDIAYRAMATEIANRYQSVRELQDALREYLAHVESINLTERGEKLLQRAKTNGQSSHGEQGGRFDEFDRARFSFEEALQIWPGNRTARTRQAETLLAYAGYAYDEGAYARGITLLSEKNPAHHTLLRKLKAARRKTDRLSILLKAAVLLIIIGGSLFSVFLFRAWVDADTQRIAAEVAERTARENAQEAKRQEGIAKLNENKAKKNAAEAKRQEGIAKLNENEAKKNAAEAKRQEGIAKLNENEAKKNAVEALKQEGIAKLNENEAQRSSYAFEIGLAAGELQRNAFDHATEILVSQTQSAAKSPLRSWEWGYLKAMVSLDAKTFDDHGKLPQGRVEATAISDNHEWVASGTGSGDIYLWRFDRSEQPVRLPYGEVVSAVAITADGSTLLAAGRGEGGRHAVKAWSLPARDGAAADRELGSHAAPILSLDLSSDSTRVLTGAKDGTVMISQLVGTGESTSFPATSQESSIWSARFSTDGNWIVTAGEDGTVRVWNAKVNQAQATSHSPMREVQRFEGHEGPVYTAAFSPDGRTVVSGGRDRQLLAMPFDPQQARQSTYSPAEVVRSRLADTGQTPQRAGAVLLGEHDAAVRSLSFANDGTVLFSAGHDHTVRVWDVASGVAEATLVKTLRGHGGWVRSCVALPHDPESVLSGGYDRRVRVWNWRTYAFPRVLRHESHRSLGELELTAGAASPDGKWVASASASGMITLWDMTDPLNPKPQELAEGHDWQATTGKYFQHDQRLLTAGGDNTALVWDVQHGNELVRMGGWNTPVGTGWRGVATVSSDGQWIATGAEGKVLARIWDANTGKLITEIPIPGANAWPENEQSMGELAETTALAFSPDGEYLTLGDQWGTCYLVSVKENWTVLPWEAHQGKISAIEFLPESRGFLSASSDGTVQEWALNSNGIALRTTFRHADRVIAMDLSDDGSTMITAAGSDDDQAVLRIWDRSRPKAPRRSLSLSEIGGDHSSSGGKNSMVRSVTLHSSEARVLVTVFDPQTSTYHVGQWTWSNENHPYRLISTSGLRDVSTALFAPHQSGAFLTIGGRGARLQKLTAAATSVSMTYRPQAGIRSLSFSVDGEKLLSASADGSLKIWTLDPDQRRWKPEAKLVGRHDAPINSVVFHPSRNDRFLTASDDGTAKLWQSRDGDWTMVQSMTTPGGQSGPMKDARFLAGPGDNLRIVTAGTGGAYLWDGAEAAPRAIGDNGSISCVVPSPDGRWIVVASGSTATIYNAATLQPTATPPLSGHLAEITSMAFTADGSRLFTTSRDYTVKLWNTQTILADPNRANQQQANQQQANQQRELLTLEGHSDEVTSVSVITRSSQPFVLTTGLDGQAILWPNEVP